MPGSKRKTPRKRTPAQARPRLEADIAAVARRSFGFQTLRPGQEDAIRALLSKRDCLAVMPTGSGKSAIYQIAGLMMPHSTVVISPLIALQKDQVDAINSAEPAAAVVVNSAQRVADAREALERIEEGRGKYIFLAPEQLRKESTFESLQSAKISMFVIDEAHCISEWGHDFRPDYLQLGPVIERLGHPVVLAITATAAPEVRDEIIHRLHMRRPSVFVHGFDRPNIHLRVDRFENENEKTDALIHHFAGQTNLASFTQQPERTPRQSVKPSRMMALRVERQSSQDAFMNGESEVIVATNAFGMGIDKADVRFVYHFDVPDSLDSY